MTETQRPDWLKPGAEVVIWTDDYGYRVLHVKRTKVAMVAQKSFTVEGTSDRFDVQRMATKGGGAWDRERHVAAVDSEKAKAVLEESRQQQLTHRAWAAVDQWNKKRTRENRLAAIAALQAVEVDEVPL